MQTQTQTQKRGKGRPKGSSSFVSVTLDDLAKMFKGSDKITVGRVWLTSQPPKITINVSEQSNPTTQRTAEQPVVEMQLED